MKYIRVRNFEKFQHYHDGNRQPIWIKLYNRLLDNFHFCLLPDEAKFHLIGIWLLASKNNNKIPAVESWLDSRLSSTKKVDINLLATNGFIELFDASEDNEVCYEDATLDKNREDKSREEREQDSRPTGSPDSTPPGFSAFWQLWPRHFRKVGKSKCLSAWKKRKLEPLTEPILAALRACRGSEDWSKDGGQFIPMPFSWLGKTPWESDLQDLAMETKVDPEEKKYDHGTREEHEAKLRAALGEDFVIGEPVGVGTGGEDDLLNEDER